MGFSRQEYWSGLPLPSPGDLPEPGIDPRSPALQTLCHLSRWGNPSSCLSFLLKVPFKHLGELCLKFLAFTNFQREAKMATKDVQGQNVTGKLFCFKWLKTESLPEKALAAKGGPRVAQLRAHSLFQRKERHGHEARHPAFMRKFSLLTPSAKVCPNWFLHLFPLTGL